MSHLRFGAHHLWSEAKNGVFRLRGTVTVTSAPAIRRVRLYRMDTGVIMGETWSDADGLYEFKNIAPNIEYYVIGFDHTGAYDPEAKAMLYAEPM